MFIKNIILHFQKFAIEKKSWFETEEKRNIPNSERSYCKLCGTTVKAENFCLGGKNDRIRQWVNKSKFGAIWACVATLK